VVAFANTGKEREETLRFVHECGSRWGVPIVWLEFLKRSGPWGARYERVGFNSANRDGAPLARLIASKKTTPNALRRFCTEEAKVNTILAFIKTELGWPAWKNVIGLRHDEGTRCLKKYAQNDAENNPWTHVLPLDKGKVTKADVAAFWATQEFDLGLRGYEGNCDLCFVKGRGALKALIRERPGCVDWWIEMERIGNGRFVTEYSYADLKREVEQQPHLFEALPADDEHDVECGLLCEPEAA
jgi:3'-phosphoadenosine 5'-phosphosulfate sulfotransferase (PAPS reductase)/FAD synthetase